MLYCSITQKKSSHTKFWSPETSTRRVSRLDLDDLRLFNLYLIKNDSMKNGMEMKTTRVVLCVPPLQKGESIFLSCANLQSSQFCSEEYSVKMVEQIPFHMIHFKDCHLKAPKKHHCSSPHDLRTLLPCYIPRSHKKMHYEMEALGCVISINHQDLNCNFRFYYWKFYVIPIYSKPPFKLVILVDESTRLSCSYCST
ncbi:uncharacterized protein LOC126797016 [Argentina anserina]|uniref:uncharacterized protein LOC126797016 n=1 Tax=Argentina anserina TaxID=57926 RepID=UPI0021765AA4|nr:uncharacterized protein LOC126797016 [Potentilla anserina]